MEQVISSLAEISAKLKEPVNYSQSAQQQFAGRIDECIAFLSGNYGAKTGDPGPVKEETEKDQPLVNTDGQPAPLINEGATAKEAGEAAEKLAGAGEPGNQPAENI